MGLSSLSSAVHPQSWQLKYAARPLTLAAFGLATAWKGIGVTATSIVAAARRHNLRASLSNAACQISGWYASANLAASASMSAARSSRCASTVVITITITITIIITIT
eukprot:1475544-Prymnesium_polylepis.2